MKKKQPRFLKSILFFIFLLAGAGVGYFAGKWGISHTGGLSKSTGMVLLLFFVPAFFIVIAFHEAGHALAGVWVNFDFKMYVVGPFMWTKEQSGWKFKWNKNVNTAGGMVVCLPSGSSDLSKRFSLYAAGGPLASVLLAALAYLLFRFMYTAEAPGNSFLQIASYCFLLIGILSAFIFILTAIPIHVGGFSSDGARVIKLWRGGDAAKFEVLILKIITGSCSGIRPKLLKMDELLEAQALAIKLNAPNGVYLHSYLHQAAFDSNNVEKAEKHLQDYLDDADKIPEGIRNAVWLDACFFYAFAKSDLSRALYYWEKFKPSSFIPKAQVSATEAAISLLKNERENVLLKVKDSLREIPNMMDKGVALALQEKLLVLKDSVT